MHFTRWTAVAVFLLAAPVRADLLTFELTPAGDTPTDNAPLTEPYNVAGGSVRLFFDTNGNNVYDAGDVNPRFEARGNMDDGPQGFRSNKNGGSDRPAGGMLGSWFLRQPDGIGVLPGPFILDYDVTETIDALSGEIWDIDSVSGSATERWRIDVLDSSGEVVATEISPLGLLQANPTSLDSLPWAFSFTGLSQLSADVDKVRLTFTGTKTDGIGLSFDNFNAFASILPGDYNDNGVVDAADYTVWRDHLGQTFSLPNEHPAAVTIGLVDEEDFDFWYAQFGESDGAGAAEPRGTAVPEPTTATLAIFGSLALAALAASRM